MHLDYFLSEVGRLVFYVLHYHLFLAICFRLYFKVWPHPSTLFLQVFSSQDKLTLAESQLSAFKLEVHTLKLELEEARRDFFHEMSESKSLLLEIFRDAQKEKKELLESLTE